MNSDYLKLCLITHSQKKSFILQAIEGGVTCIQLREKSKDLNQIYNIALELKNILTSYKIPLIINDHIEIAKAVDADGVHLGQSDCSPIDARQILGPNKIIGWSIETLKELDIANQLTCIDYIAASAVFESQTKTDCKTIWGLDGLKEIIRTAKHPTIAIGGITQDNVESIIETGAAGVAVISAIHNQKNPKEAAIHLINKINQTFARKQHV